VRRFVVLAVAALIAIGGGLLIGGPVKAPNAAAQSTTSTTKTTATTPASTSTTPAATPPASTSAPAATTTSAEPAPKEPTYDWGLIAIEGLLVIGFIALGVRSGGMGLGLWGGVGTLVLVFGFGLDPGEPPVDAMLIIIAVIGAAAAMEAAGGIDYMVMIASGALRARPRSINYAAPFVSYVLCILTGTSNTFYSIVPVINEVAYANKIRPERPLAGSTVASALGITSSPVAAAMATLLPLVEAKGYDLVDVLLITIPSSLVAIIVMSFVMNKHGKELIDDPEYKRRLEAGEVQPPAPAAGRLRWLPPCAAQSLIRRRPSWSRPFLCLRG
jgi:anaerobic C4-dicarboxylate transporter